MIDSHSHIYAPEFDDDRDEMMARARAAGVSHIVLPNENLATVERLKAVRDRYPDYVSMALGLHPEEVRENWQEILDEMKLQLNQDHWVAIGEIGVDLYWDKTYREQQLEALDTQLRWCVERELPFIIHCREALDEILWVMDNFGTPLPQGVFHCFTGTVTDVEQVRRRGDFYFGVNGVVTFKKSTVHELLPIIGLDRILLETDAPYLAPVPHRGQRNESAWVAHVAQCVAQWLQTDLDVVAQVTTASATKLFHLSQQQTK
ncbi:MAG: TatD family hydrolase [Muribaculaceae bacterium]|nr:TatD family hydrolase [Muribaculaceae bacterium]